MGVLIAALALSAVALQVPDVLTTNKVISNGGRELNPLVRWYMSKTGKWWWTLKLAAVPPVAMVYWFYVSSQLPAWGALAALGAINVIYVYVLVNNTKALKRQLD